MKKFSSILILIILSPAWLPIATAMGLIILVFFAFITSVLSIGWAHDNLRGKPTIPYAEILKEAWPL